MLQSIEAEETVLSYFLGVFGENEDKERLILMVNDNMFTIKEYRKIIKLIKRYSIFNSVILLEKAKEEKVDIDPNTLSNLIAAYSSSYPEVIESHIKVLHDKTERRRLYKTAKNLAEDLENGEDYISVALQAVNELSVVNTSDDAKSANDIIKNMMHNPKEGRKIPTGYNRLDNALGGHTRGNMVVIAGDSGQMKTTIAIDMAERILAKDKSLHGAIFSKEMLKEDLSLKLISKRLKIEVSELINDNYDKEEALRVIEDYEPLKRLDIIPAERFSHSGDIARIQLAKRYDFWIVDYAQLLDSTGGKNPNNASDFNISVSNNVKALKSLTTVTESVGIVLSQLVKGVDKRTVKRPTVSDIEWSGVIKQLASYIIFSYYPYKYYKDTTIAPKDYYYLLGEKTRFSQDFTLGMKVEPEYGIFNEDIPRSERMKMTNVLNRISNKQ